MELPTLYQLTHFKATLVQSEVRGATRRWALSSGLPDRHAPIDICLSSSGVLRSMEQPVITTWSLGWILSPWVLWSQIGGPRKGCVDWVTPPRPGQSHSSEKAVKLRVPQQSTFSLQWETIKGHFNSSQHACWRSRSQLLLLFFPWDVCVLGQGGGGVPSSPQLLRGSLHSEGQHPDEWLTGGPAMKGPSPPPCWLGQDLGTELHMLPGGHTCPRQLWAHWTLPRPKALGWARQLLEGHSGTSGSLRYCQGDWKVQWIKTKQIIHQEKNKHWEER